MKILLLFLFMFAVMGIQTMAQPKIDRNAGKMNPGVKKAIADKAAIDKILNATVSKVELKISKIPHYIGLTSTVFYNQKIILKENNNGDFVLKQTLNEITPIRAYPNGKQKPYDEIYSLTPNTTTRYKDLLNNGFTVNIDFTNHKGFVFYGDFIFTFYFTDGTVAPVHLQEILNLSTKGHYTAAQTDELHVSKNMPGSVFPDPENPLVLPPVK